jgi:hypothetical protein
MRVAFEAVPEINVPALTLLLMSVTEVAVMEIAEPEAAEAEAVKLVTTSLPVDPGLNVPQAPAGEQLQITPAVSRVTLALTFTIWPG